MKISVFGLFRDSEKTINESLSTLEELSNNKSINTEFFFYENDSLDRTREIVSEWMKGKDGKFFYENIGSKKFGSVMDINRLVLMAYYRNKLKKSVGPVNSHYVLLIDTDIVYKVEHVEILIDYLESNSKAVMATANTRQREIPDVLYNQTSDSFYDVAACRDRFFNRTLFFSNCPLIMQDDRDDWLSGIPVKVTSAFSGLSLARSNAFNLCKWSTTDNSEHVNFCTEMLSHGDIYIIPNCRPFSPIDINMVNMDQMKAVGEKQRSIIQYYNSAYNISTSTSLHGNIK